MSVLQVRNLTTRFKTPDGPVTAVDDVTLEVAPRETLAIAGESGSGKSALALSIMRLNAEPPCFYPSGEIHLDGKDLLTLTEAQLQGIRGNEVAMIFQDPMTSLNPVVTVGNQVAETLRIHQRLSRKQARKKAIDVLADVGIPNPRQRASEYPHQYSGGMRQRAMIAMGLSCNPKVLIADEPTTALDVTIQAQILELITSLQDRYETAVIIISHDLGVVAQVADRVAVMYAGQVVESGPTREIFQNSLMPYTWSLLRAVPRLDTDDTERLLPIEGQPPSLLSLPTGCSFSPRCPFARSDCHRTRPELTEKQVGHEAACLLTPAELAAVTSSSGDHQEANSE